MEVDENGRPYSKRARCPHCGCSERILADESWDCPRCGPELIECPECGQECEPCNMFADPRFDYDVCDLCVEKADEREEEGRE